ncbi:MAG: NAD(P)/FAD-dependent oxidoreductase [Stomatobaculum sp.]
MTDRVCVIGGGPAGLTAAISAARHGFRTTLLEKRERVGKKLLLTGNGKCNYTNRRVEAACYHSAEAAFPMRALERFGSEDTIRWFRSLGIEPLDRHGGWIYPHSEQAASVLNALRAECALAGVRIVTAVDIRKIRKNREGRFQIMTGAEMIAAERLILATGSKAAGADGSGYAYAEAFGHHLVPPLPALCGLYCAEKEFFRAVSGVRVTGIVSLLLEGRPEERAEGELQLNNYGLSGIPVFQLSRTAARALHRGRRTELRVNFLPDYVQVAQFFKRRASDRAYGTLEAFGNGFLNKNLWNGLVKRAGLKPGMDPAKLSGKEFQALADAVNGSCFRVIRTADFAQAQTCSGGVTLDEVNPETMESKLVPGLYFAGEILDVDGICGGYNLQWCWTSGQLAGAGK